LLLVHHERGGESRPASRAHQGERSRADASDDGRLDLSDPIATLNYLFLSAAGVAPGFAACGEDPTADQLGPCAYLHCAVQQRFRN